ncbi:MAG: hypothetical protein WCP08_01640 [Prolixibacteraceae bacterium]
MKKLGYGVLFIAFFFIPYFVGAQYFVVGQDPASVRWRQIQTDNFQIIYPSDNEVQAQRVAHIFEKVFSYLGNTLNHQPKKISVILHSKSNKSNGFVAWSPSRVELFPTPGQEMYAQDWIEQLAIHELRHHVQIDKIESELPSIFKILLGEQAASIVVGAYLPFWFLEGDAVVAETAFSQTGRGRLPSFSMELKAQVDQKAIYNFDKAYLGSYKNYIPDHYQLGYQMIANIRNQNGGDVWGMVLHHIARNPLGINSLSRGLKLATGKNQDQHYVEIMNNLKLTKPFRFDSQNDTTNTNENLVKSSKVYTSYRYPYFVDSSSLVALKTSLDNIPRFVLMDGNSKEKELFVPGLIQDESMSFVNGKIVWMETKPDLRWAHQEGSLLRILDIYSKELWEMNYSEKLFAPVMSPDGKLTAAVKISDQNLASIILISNINGKIIREFKAFDHHTFFTPSWSSDQSSLYAIELGSKGKAIIRMDLTTGEVTEITRPTFGDIRKPFQRDHFLYYSSDLAGKSEGYALDLVSHRNYRIARAKYGIKDLQSSADGNSIVFGNYSSDGYRIAVKSIDASRWEDETGTHKFQDTLANHLTFQEKGIIDFSNPDTTQYSSKKYIKAKNLFNIHSWSPIYIDPDATVVNAGFSIVSQNKLSTAMTQFGYDYSSVNQTGKWVGKFEYAGWYPVLNFYGDYGKEKSRFYQINQHYNSRNQLISQDTVMVPYTQTVMNLKLDASVPLNFSRGKMYRLVQPEFQVGYSYKWQDSTTPVSIFRGSYIPFTYRIYAHNLRQQSLRDIQPKWGQTIDFAYRHTPLGNRQLGAIFSMEGTCYLPGTLKNHGIRIYTGYQEKKSDYSYFSDIIEYPRGYANIENNRLLTLRTDYVLPLLYPDWHIWHLYYLKRISLRIHYDYAKLVAPIHPSGTINKTMSSTGMELLTDCHFLRFIAPVKLGIRESYLIESKTVTSEFIFSVNLKGL